MRMSKLSQAEPLRLCNAGVGSNFALQHFYVADLQSHGFPHDCEQLFRLRCITVFALQVRHPSLLRSKPAFAFGHEVFGPRSSFRTINLV